MSTWVNTKQIAAMRKLKRAIDTCDVELYKEAVGLYGESMHALTDETSPSHVGTQTWYGVDSKLVLSPVVYALYVKKHKDAETDDVLRPMLNGIVTNLVTSQVKMLVLFFELAQQPIETLWVEY